MKSALNPVRLVDIEDYTFHNDETDCWISRIEPLLVLFEIFRNQKLFQFCLLGSDFSNPLHFNAEILLFLFLILYIFSSISLSFSLEKVGVKTGVFFICLIIFPKWLLTKVNDLLNLSSESILFLLQNIITLALDFNCLRYFIKRILSS